jgi:hypothetical protein
MKNDEMSFFAHPQVPRIIREWKKEEQREFYHSNKEPTWQVSFRAVRTILVEMLFGRMTFDRMLFGRMLFDRMLFDRIPFLKSQFSQILSFLATGRPIPMK